jgi:PAS domain S-box-containing protein
VAAHAAAGAAAEARDLFVAGLERALQPLDDPAEIMVAVARLVGEQLACDRCAYAEVEADEDHFTMTGGHARGLPPLTGRMAMSDFGAEALRCLRAGEPYVVADASTDPHVLPEQREIYRRTGIAAVVSVSLHKGGRVVAGMAVHHATPRAWTDADVGLLLTAVNRCWESLQRVHALDALRRNEERYRLLVERASDGIWLVDEHGRVLDVNPAACAMLGYPRAEHLGSSIGDLVRADELPRLAALLRALPERPRTEVWELRRRDGSRVPLELSMVWLGHGRFQAVGRDITARRRAEAERERLLDRERAANRQLRLLQDATAALSAAATPDQVARVTVAQLRQLLGVEPVAAWGLRGDRLEALEVDSWPERPRERWGRIALDAGNPATDAVRSGTPLWLTSDDEWGGRYPDQRRELAADGYGGVAALPLTVAGRCLGVVVAAFTTTTTRAAGATERATAEALADQCAQALHRAGLLAAERDARRAAEEFGHVVAALSCATDPDDVVEVVLGQAEVLGATGVAVVAHHAGRLDFVAGRGAYGSMPAALAEDHPLTRAIRTRTPEWDGPLAVPLLLSDRAIGAVGLWFADGPPELGPDRRSAVLTVAGQCALALDRARLHQAEHEVADVLQRSLLPARLPPLTRLAGAARYTPAAEHALSGGDWYDMLQVGDTAVALVVGDVVGHGPAAAAIMGQLRSVLAAQLLDGCGPAQALERLDRFAGRVAGSAGSTCACLLYDWSTGTLRWALAGHPPVLLVDGSGTRFLGADLGDPRGAGAVLGLRDRAPYREGSTTLEPGASAVLYTDGLVERRGELLDAGLRRLGEAAGGLAGLGPAGLVDALVDAVLDDVGPADDVAVLAVRAVPPPLEGRLPAAGTSMRVLRRAVGEWADAAGLDAELVEDLELTLGEAAANAAEHAYAATTLPEEERVFTYGVARTADGGVEVRVGDRGRWRPVPDDNGFRGHGLRVIGQLADDLDIDRAPDGTRVRFRLPAPPPDPARPVRRTGGPRDPGAPAQVRELPGRRFAVTGDIDTDGRAAIAPVLLAAVGPGPLTVDLTAVRHLSSAGVALLAQLTALAGPALSVVVAAGSVPARVCALTGLPATVQPAADPASPAADPASPVAAVDVSGAGAP